MSLHVNTLNYVSFAYQLYAYIVLIVCSANYSDHLKNFIIMYLVATVFKFVVLTIIHGEIANRDGTKYGMLLSVFLIII